MWRVGCFYGNGEELIKKAYADSELSGKCYEAIVRAVETIETAKAEAKGEAISNAYGLDKTENKAQLISAAPELYEALRMYQEVFAEIRKSAWFLDANFHEIMSLNKVMTAADAALAKAAGESEVKE